MQKSSFLGCSILALLGVHQASDKRSKLLHIGAHVAELVPELVDLTLQGINLLLLGSLVVVRLSDLGEKIRASALELLMAEFPELGLFIFNGVTDAEGIRLDLSESIEIQLSHK
jgi:hypothetical protein